MAAKKVKFERNTIAYSTNFCILFAFFLLSFRTMSRQLKGLQNNITFYLPFTWYFAVFATCCLLGYKWLSSRPKLPDTAYADIFPLLLSIAAFFICVILSVSLLSVLISFIFFLWKKRKNAINFSVATQPLHRTNGAQRQTIQLHIHPVIKPLLGFVKIRLQYDELHYSKKFSLVEQRQKKLISTSIDGNYHWNLPAIKEYRIEKAVIYFEDFFQFFSLALPVAASNRFYTQPQDADEKIIQAMPRKTEDTSTRIEELKRVEGEYVNYKNFEGNDDVRRIVWKIYAKNKDLVVRIPEVLDPYASHIYLYASFYAAGMPQNDIIDIPFLNYYKSKIWNVYRQLVKEGFDVRYIPDQPIAAVNTGDIQQGVKYGISTSKWQASKDLKQYVQTKDAAMVMVSSLSDPEQVGQMVEKYGNEISFVFVQLTRSFDSLGAGDWLQWIFVQNESNAVNEYKRKWSLSMARAKITENEKRLREIMAKHSKAVQV